MSGSTRISGGGRYWKTLLETPCISFASPRHGEESAEMRYHSEASARFHRAIDEAKGPLDTLLAAIAARYGIVPLDEPGCELALSGHSQRGPRWRIGGNVVVRTRQPLPESDQQELSWHVVRLLDRISRPHPRGDDENFHLVRWPDGTIEDDGGQAPGWPVPDEMPPHVRAEVARRCAEIVGHAERFGVIHADLGPDRVRFDEDGRVSVGGYGESHRSPRAPDAPHEWYQALDAEAPDWIGIQRYGLGLIAAAWLPGAQGERPDPVALAANLTPSDALETWLEETWVRGLPLPTRAPRGSVQITARIAAGARGVLLPCRVCETPTLLGAVSARIEGGRFLPLCRACERRENVFFWVLPAGLGRACTSWLSSVIRWRTSRE